MAALLYPVSSDRDADGGFDSSEVKSVCERLWSSPHCLPCQRGEGSDPAAATSLDTYPFLCFQNLQHRHTHPSWRSHCNSLRLEINFICLYKRIQLGKERAEPRETRGEEFTDVHAWMVVHIHNHDGNTETISSQNNKKQCDTISCRESSADAMWLHHMTEYGSVASWWPEVQTLPCNHNVIFHLSALVS